MNNVTFEAFRSSLLRCVSNLHFLERFYDEFINAAPEVAEVFAHTNMERQKAMLNASLYHLMNVYNKAHDYSKQHLQELGATHGAYGHRIPMHLYDVWLDSLIIAVKESDPMFSPTLEAAWREVMGHGIEIMKASSHLYPPGHQTPSNGNNNTNASKPFLDAVHKLAEQFQESAKEAAHRSDFERDIEVTAFQFGQYRAYMHAYEMLNDLLKRHMATTTGQ